MLQSSKTLDQENGNGNERLFDGKASNSTKVTRYARTDAGSPKRDVKWVEKNEEDRETSAMVFAVCVVMG